MPDVVRWLLAVVSSVVIAGIVFVLATVGIVVAFFVFLVLFVLIGLALRRQRKHGAAFGNSSSFVFYTNMPNGSPSGADTELHFRRLAASAPAADPTGQAFPTDHADRADHADHADHTDHAAGQTYDLSPDDYTVEPPAGVAGSPEAPPSDKPDNPAK